MNPLSAALLLAAASAGPAPVGFSPDSALPVALRALVADAARRECPAAGSFKELETVEHREELNDRASHDYFYTTRLLGRAASGKTLELSFETLDYHVTSPAQEKYKLLRLTVPADCDSPKLCFFRPQDPYAELSGMPATFCIDRRAQAIPGRVFERSLPFDGCAPWAAGVIDARESEDWSGVALEARLDYNPDPCHLEARTVALPYARLR